MSQGSKRLAVAVLAAACLAGCGSGVDSTASPSAAASSPTVAPAACLVGSWSVDLPILLSSLTSQVPPSTDRTLAGSIDLAFTPAQLTTVYNARFTGNRVAADAASPPVAVAVELHGTSTAPYEANGSTVAFSGPGAGVVITSTETVNGKTVTLKDTSAYQPLAGFTTGTVAFSCSENQLILTNQGDITLSATRKG